MESTMRSAAAGFTPRTVTDAALENIQTAEIHLSDSRLHLVPAPASSAGPTYEVLYADPPWSYSAGGKRNVKNHYPTMSIERICDLRVCDLAADDCALFMWATAPLLPEAFRVLEAWGFTYKTVAFTWVKRNKIAPSWFWGMGNWTRQNAEFCLLATRGNPKRVSKAVHSVLDDRIARHSEKPQSARDRIVELMGDVPRLEMFARTATPGWAVWGNEVPSDVEVS
jgi:N6-adenosine-specific RNA methylase IME4